MRSSKSSFINFLVVFLLGFCVFLYLIISIRFSIFTKDCETSKSPGDMMLNGVKMSDLKNMPFLPILPLQDPPDDRKTLQFPMFTFSQERGIGQMLFELSSLFGISDQLERVPVLNPMKDGKIVDRMNSMIRGDFPMFAEKFEERGMMVSDAFSVNFNIRKCCVHENPAQLSSLIQKHVLLNGVYFQSFKYFDHLKTEIRELLTPKSSSFIRSEAIVPDEFRRDFLVCVHTKQSVNRDMEISKPSDPIFTRSATDYLVGKYQSLGNSVAVAVFGNDPVWAHDLFFDKIGKSNIFPDPNSNLLKQSGSSPNYTAILTPSLSASDDLAFSRKFCDVVFLSAPTSAFGWWMGYLAKENAVIYYRDPLETPDQIVAEMKQEDYFPPDWLKLTSGELKLSGNPTHGKEISLVQ